MSWQRAHLWGLTLAACGSYPVRPHPQDAAPDVAISVHAVTCTTSAPRVTTTNDLFAFSPPSTTITQNGVVNFTMSSQHGVDSGPADVVMMADRWDPGLLVGIGDTKCLAFTQTGTFRFHDPAYNFRGSIVVE